MGSGDHFSVFASGAVMSDSLLFGMNRDLDAHIGWACQVDSRDRFGPDTLKSRYVVVTDPPVTHLRPDAQICVTIPDQDILDGKGIGAAYRRIGAYQLSGDVKGYLYQQVRPVSKTEIDTLSGEFRKHHRLGNA